MPKSPPLVAALAFLISFANAEDTLPKLQEQRRAVLKSIIEQIEAEHQAGLSPVDALFNAKVNLTRFELSLATTLTERQSLQKGIVQIEQERYDTKERLQQTGRITSKELLIAQDRLLKEKIALLNLK